jgi:hypothetical protein
LLVQSVLVLLKIHHLRFWPCHCGCHIRIEMPSLRSVFDWVSPRARTRQRRQAPSQRRRAPAVSCASTAWPLTLSLSVRRPCLRRSLPLCGQSGSMQRHSRIMYMTATLCMCDTTRMDGHLLRWLCHCTALLAAQERGIPSRPILLCPFCSLPAVCLGLVPLCFFPFCLRISNHPAKSPRRS